MILFLSLLPFIVDLYRDSFAVLLGYFGGDEIEDGKFVGGEEAADADQKSRPPEVPSPLNVIASYSLFKENIYVGFSGDKFSSISPSLLTHTLSSNDTGLGPSIEG